MSSTLNIQKKSPTFPKWHYVRIVVCAIITADTLVFLASDTHTLQEAVNIFLMHTVGMLALASMVGLVFLAKKLLARSF
jgi:hypothetical protein